jgi:hypothetical protein
MWPKKQDFVGPAAICPGDRIAAGYPDFVLGACNQNSSFYVCPRSDPIPGLSSESKKPWRYEMGKNMRWTALTLVAVVMSGALLGACSSSSTTTSPPPPASTYTPPPSPPAPVVRG